MSTDKELAKLDPAKAYKRPAEVLRDTSLSSHEKIDILQRWAYDEREISVAEEENMLNNTHEDRIILDEINRCLIELGVDSTHGRHPPTKQG